MATNFPEEIDSFLNPLSTDSVAIVSHAAQHSDTNDAIEALEAKVGKNNSTDTSSLDYKVNALNTALGNKLDSNYVTIGNTLLDGISGQTYGLIGTSEYLDVKNTNGYNKEIELDITAVESKLTVDGFALQTDISSAITALDLPNTYDAKGAADAAELDAIASANSYTDGEIVDALVTAQGYASTAQTNAETFATNAINGLDTDDIEEGATNLYFTNQKALDATSTAYDPAGAAATALSDANEYTDEAVAGLGNSLPNIYVPISDVGSIDGVASLNSSGKVPDTELDIDLTIQNVASSMITGGTHTNISTSFNNVTKKLSLSTTPLTQDQIQDFVAPLFTHTQHTNITATYDDDNNRIVLSASGGGGGGASVTISPTAPAGPTLGNIWLDSDNGSTFIWDGVFWVEVGGASTAEAIAAVTSTAPSNPSLGRIWLNSTTAKTYIYDGSYWVGI